MTPINLNFRWSVASAGLARLCLGGFLILVSGIVACSSSATPQPSTPIAAKTPTPTATPPTLTPVRTPISTPKLPPARIGDTIEGVGKGMELGSPGLRLTLLTCGESNRAVNGRYNPDTYYTFTAKPDMKFLIVQYRFENHWVKEQSTPYLHEGEVKTDKGYYYKVWSPSGGIHATEYNPVKATGDEVRLLGGDSGGFARLLPEESVTGRVAFEIPQEAVPVEILLTGVPVPILPSPCTNPSSASPPAPTPRPAVVRIFDMIEGIGKDQQLQIPGLRMTLLLCRESNKSVHGPYIGNTYYTFTAKPGMKFLILQYRFDNDWIREQSTPHLIAPRTYYQGEVKTNRGYYYKVWPPALGVNSTEYKRVPATEDEVKLLWGDSGAYKTKLLPKESTARAVAFEIPQDAVPLEISLAGVPALIVPQPCVN